MFSRVVQFLVRTPASLNFTKTIENTGQTGFSGFGGDSSQTVVTPLPVTAGVIQGILKNRGRMERVLIEIRQRRSDQLTWCVLRYSEGEVPVSCLNLRRKLEEIS